MRTRSTLLALVFIAARALAQTGTSAVPSPPPYYALNAIVADRVGLKEEQRAQWNALGVRFEQEYQALGADPTHSSGYRPMLDDRESALKALLSSDQYAKWTDLNHNTGGDKNTAPKPSPKE